jgi:hypothetical protein
MRTLADLATETHGLNVVAYYVSPTHAASAGRVIQRSGCARQRYAYLLPVFVGSGTEPCLIITSERDGEEGKPVLRVYHENEHQIRHDEPGDWMDFDAFTRRAIHLAGELCDTSFADFHPRKGMPSIKCLHCGAMNRPRNRYCAECSSDLDRCPDKDAAESGTSNRRR